MNKPLTYLLSPLYHFKINKLKILILILSLNIFTYASNLSKQKNSKIQAAYAIGIFDKNGKGENIQGLKTTKNDYNNICFSKIVVFGIFNIKDVKVNIGTSLGHFTKSRSIYNKQKIKIAQELTFKHFNIKKGYFELRINNKLYDTKVFVK